MVFIKGREVIMSATVDPDQRDLSRIDLLQGFTLPDRDDAVPGTMNNVCVAIHMAYPPVGSKMIPQHKANR